MARQVFTIGHSDHELNYFLELLFSQRINCVIDVRSIPASGRNPQYNQNALKNALSKEGIEYWHFRKEFGARQISQSVHNEEGRVDFEKFQQTDAFQQGVQQLEDGLEKGYEIALMCAEGHPLDCHRFSMISNFLAAKGFDIFHIMKDKSVIAHAEMEEELLKKYNKKLPQPSLFDPDISEEDQLAAAYRLHNSDIGWKKS